MVIEDLMTRNVARCSADDSLSDAAQAMWDYDCGCIPVVDAEDHLVGILTDRDICIAAFTQGKPVANILIRDAMAYDVYSCLPDDSIAEAEQIMRQRKVRRLPVIDLTGRLVGLVSLNDIARESARQQSWHNKDVTLEEVAGTLSAICQPRTAKQITTRV